MNLLRKIRGLWRYDGDTEVVGVTRRRFIFLGAAAAVGAALPDEALGITFNWSAPAGMTPVVSVSYDSFFTATLAAYRDQLNKHFLEYRPSLMVLLGDEERQLVSVWRDEAVKKGTPEWYAARHAWKHRRKP